MLLRVGHEALASTHSRFRVCSAQGEVYWVEPKYVVAKHILRATGRKCCIRWASCETCWKPKQAWRHFDVCRDTRVNKPPCESRNKNSFLTCSNDWYNPTRPTRQSVAPILCPMTTAFWLCCPYTPSHHRWDRPQSLLSPHRDNCESGLAVLLKTTMSLQIRNCNRRSQSESEGK